MFASVTKTIKQKKKKKKKNKNGNLIIRNKNTGTYYLCCNQVLFIHPS